jgi:large subunit ribosomal protein L9e
MKILNSFELVKIPEGLSASVKSRVVTVTGPRGSLNKSFNHLAIDIYMADKDTIKIEKWFGKTKQIAAVRTVKSHIENMFKGVTKGYLYKMRAVYAHFPINCAITEGGTLIEVRNFLGEKFIRKVRMHPGVTVENSKGQKDELIVQEESVQIVSKLTSRNKIN